MQGDVWSFGVLLDEICSLGVTPFPGFRTYGPPFIQHLEAGARFPPSGPGDQGWHPVLRPLIAECMALEPASRPSFKSLVPRLGAP